MKVKISLEYDCTTNTVSNVQVTDLVELDNVVESKVVTEPKPKATSEKKSTKKSKKDQDEIILEDNKLVLTEKLVELIKAKPGDRLLVSFKEINNVYIPVISKSEVYADSETGNKLTKSLTLSYRGKQREQLEVYGTQFKFEELEPNSGICKLIGEIEVKPDDKVTTSNIDIVTRIDDLEEVSKKSYTRELKTPMEISFEEDDDFNITEDDLELDEISDEDFKNLLQ